MSERTSLRSIYVNEIGFHHSSPLLPVITGIFLFISGIFFFNSLIYENLLATRIAQYQPSDWIGVNALIVQPALSNMVLLVIMMAPLILMRLNVEAESSDEEKSPASSFKSLLGKYLAGLSVLMGIIVSTSVMPALTALFVPPDWGLIFCSYGGLVLLGGTVLAVRAFASSLTKYRITATALTFGFIIVLWSVGWYSTVLPGDYRGVILEELSLAHHLSPFLKGVVSLKGIAYFFEMSLFFLVLSLSVASLRRKRKSDKAGKLSDILGPVLFSTLFAAILVTVYLVVINHDARWNLNISQRYGLGQQTKRIVHSLGFGIRVRAFEAQGQERARVRDLLDLYSQELETITYEIIDPDARPGLARHLGITRYGQAVLTGNGKDVLISAATEEEITNAMLLLKQGRKKNIYFLSGHGESEISDTGRYGLSELAKALKLQGFCVKELLLMRRNDMPGDADLLIIPSPKISLMPQELALVQGYIDRGGRLLIALEPRTDGGLKGLLEGLGVGIGNDIIEDPSSKAAGGDDTMLLIDSFGGIKELSGFNCATLLPTARILKVREKLPPYIKISSLAKTSDQSRWRNGPPSIAPKEQSIADSSSKGPFDIALFVRVAISEDIGSGIMVFGDADFLTNTYLNVAGNSFLALNCIGALLGEGQSMRIVPNQFHYKPFLLTPVETLAMFLIMVILVPTLVLSLVLAMRRKRRLA